MVYLLAVRENAGKERVRNTPQAYTVWATKKVIRNCTTTKRLDKREGW